jgi:hypothetical protein
MNKIKVEPEIIVNKKKEFNWRNVFSDYKIKQSEKLTGD